MFLFLDHRSFSAPFSNALDLWRCSCYVRTYLKVEVLNMCPSQCTHLVIHNVRCVLIRCPHQNISVSYPSAITSQIQSVKVVLECHVTVLINRTRRWRGLVLTKWSNWKGSMWERDYELSQRLTMTNSSHYVQCYRPAYCIYNIVSLYVYIYKCISKWHVSLVSVIMKHFRVSCFPGNGIHLPYLSMATHLHYLH